MKKLGTSAAIAVVVLSLTGCHTTLHPNYEPTLTQADRGMSISINKAAVDIQVTDVRGCLPRAFAVVDNPSYFGYETELFNWAASYQLAQPVGKYLQTSLTKAFEQAGYSINAHEGYKVAIRLLGTRVYSERAKDFGDVIAHAVIRTEVQILDASKTNVLWQAVIGSDGTYRQKMDDTKEHMLNRAIDDAVNQLANQLVNNPILGRS